MSDHLTPDQFAKCFVNGAKGLELRHITECPRCSDELDRFGSAVASFRSTVRHRIDVHVESEVPEVSSFPAYAPAIRAPRFLWVLATAAVVVLGLIPVLTIKTQPEDAIDRTSAETDPDALMGAINLHLLRTVPAPMEPMLGLVPSTDANTELGGVR
ncbi:MAG TPA: hypothetical protein VMT78_04930 [Terriglobia bacterium]|nr:hypothetical protein [Terriglobia bacterium]